MANFEDLEVELEKKQVTISNFSIKSQFLFEDKVEFCKSLNPNVFFTLHQLNPDSFELIAKRTRNWSSEVTADDDELLFIPTAELPVTELFCKKLKKNLLIVGESGVGKTCLLRNLYSLLKSGSINGESSKLNPQGSPTSAFYICAKQFAYYFFTRNLSVTEILAIVAINSLEINEQLNDETYELFKEEIKSILFNEKVVLLVDNLEMISMRSLQSVLQMFTKKNLEAEGIKNATVILTMHTNALQVIENRREFLGEFESFCLTPGAIFDVITSARMPYLQSWDVTKKLEDGIGPNFEQTIRVKRIKMYPDHVTSPFLLYSITWKLVSDFNFSPQSYRTPNETPPLHLYNVFEAIFDSSLRSKYRRFIQRSENIAAVNSPHPFQNVPQNRFFLSEHNLENCPLLIKYEIDIAQLKRLCSLVGFLCQWFQPIHSILNPLRSSSKSTNPFLQEIFLLKYDHYFENVNQIIFIAMQIQHLLSRPGLANLMGFNIEERRNVRDMTQEFINITSSDAIYLTLEIVVFLSEFYQLTEDGNLKCIHPAFQEFLAARFITDNAVYTSSVIGHLVTAISTRHFVGKKDSAKLNLKPFDISKSYILTSWKWEWPLLFAAMRRGVYWLSDRIFEFPSRTKRDSEKALDTFMKSLAKLGYDVNDLGQVKLQIIFRSYSTVCLYRSEIENANDPLTEYISSLFLRFLEHSPSVLVHLEVYPNNFLSLFSQSAANTILKKCFGIFTSRLIAHSINMISKFKYSPHLPSHLTDVIEMALKSHPKLCPGVVSILRKIDTGSFEKSYLNQIVHFLSNPDPTIKSEITSFITSIGLHSARQIPTESLIELFDHEDVIEYITQSYKIITCIVETCANESVFHHPNKRVVDYYRNFSTIIALLEQSDPGCRLLAFLIMGDKNYLQDDTLEDGKHCRKAALYLCFRLHQLTSSSLIFNNNENNIADQKIGIENFKNDKAFYCFTVSLNTIITQVLGEKAACWVSSFSRILTYKKNLIRKVNSKIFSTLSPECKYNLLEEFLLKSNNLSMQHEILKVINIGSIIDEIGHCVDIISQFLIDHIQSHSPNFLKEEIIHIYSRVIYLAPEKLPVSQLICSVVDDNNNINNNISNSMSNNNSHFVKYQTSLMNACSKALNTCISKMYSLKLENCSLHVDDLRRLLETLADFKTFLNSYFVITTIFETLSVLPPNYFILSDETESLDHLYGEGFPLITPSLLCDIIIEGTGHMRSSLITWLSSILPSLPKNYNLKLLIQVIVSLFEHPQWQVKGTAVSVLISIARNGFQADVETAIATLLSKDTLSSSTIECCVHTVTQFHSLHLSFSLSKKILTYLYHSSNRVKISVIDFLPEVIANMDAQEQIQKFLVILNYLQNPDSEVRSASENAMLKIKKFYLSSPPPFSFLNPPHSFIKFLSDCLTGKEYYFREAAVLLFEFLGEQYIIQNHHLFSPLLLDHDPCVRIAAMKVLRSFLPKIISHIHSSILQSLEDKNELVKRSCLRLLQFSDDRIVDYSEPIQLLFNKPLEIPEVRLKALVTLSVTKIIADKHVTTINDLLKACSKDTRLLSEISTSLVKGGYSIARLVPKLINIIKQNEQSLMKRKLLRLLKPFEHLIYADYPSIHVPIMSMVYDNDSAIRKKAYEIIGKFISLYLLPFILNHPFEASKNIIHDLVKVLTTGNFDKNSLVRKEAAIGLGEIGKHVPSLRNEILEIIFSNNDEEPSQSIIVWRLLSMRWGVLIRSPKKPSRR